MEFSAQSDIARSPDEVFDRMADARNEPSWNTQVSRPDLVSGDQVGPGAKFVTVNISGNISFIEPFGRKSNRLSTCAPSPRAVIVAAGDPQGHRQAVRELQALLRGRLNPGRLESII